MNTDAALMPRRVLVTGAGGYVGSVLVGQLLRAGHHVIAVDRFFFGEHTIAAWVGHPRLDVVRGDTRTMGMDVLAGVDAVVDLAALSNDPAGDLDPALTRAVNHRARVRLATGARQRGVRRYVLASSCSVYGAGGAAPLQETAPPRPLTTYAECNVLAERDLLALSDQSFAVTAVRNATLFGASPRMRFDLVVNLMTLDATTTGRITVLGGGRQMRPFLHVADAARCLRTVLDAPVDRVEGEIFNAGLVNHRIIDVAGIVARRLPLPVEVVVVPADADARDYRADFNKLRKVLGFAPGVTVEQGVDEIHEGLRAGALTDAPQARTVAWYRTLMMQGALDATAQAHGTAAGDGLAVPGPPGDRPRTRRPAA